MWGLGTSEWVTIAAVAIPALVSIIWWMSAMYSRVDAQATAMEGLQTTLDKFAEHNRDEHSSLWKTVTDNRKSSHDTATELWRAHNLLSNKTTELDTRLTGVEDRVECLEDKAS